MALSPFYTYIQELLTAGRPFSVKLSSGELLNAGTGDAHLSTAGALSVQTGNKTLAVNESTVVYVEHGGGPMS